MARKKVIVLSSIITLAAVATVATVLGIRHLRPRWTVMQGALIRRDSDVRKQSPIAGARVTAFNGKESATAVTDNSGYFRLTFPGALLPGQTVNLKFEHPDYKPLNMGVAIRFRSSSRELVIASMVPVSLPPVVVGDRPLSVVSNIRVRYTVNSSVAQNIGSAARTFQVVNHGDVPCRHLFPCSPDKNWKATTGSVVLDAGAGNEFRDVRASCIAGPCPFTRLDTNDLENRGQTLTVSALDWSETATFLVEAEVFHTSMASDVRESYPVIFGRALNFTLPATAEGVSLEADLDGNAMVFPLGPDLYLSWANCAIRPGNDQEKSALYLCSLKDDYRF